MKLQYFGHSFWGVYTKDIRIVIDPFDDIGYPIPKDLYADYVIISHEHHDHNNVSIIKGTPKIIRSSAVHYIEGGTAELISVFHDDESGKKRGMNNIIMLSIDGLKLVHCGDLGHLPSGEVLQKINKADILLIPVGEVYTLALNEAWKLINAIQPRIIFPMHYKTPELGFGLGELETFSKKAEHVIKHNSNTIEITQELLNSDKTIVMNWKGED